MTWIGRGGGEEAAGEENLSFSFVSILPPMLAKVKQRLAELQLSADSRSYGVLESPIERFKEMIAEISSAKHTEPEEIMGGGGVDEVNSDLLVSW